MGSTFGGNETASIFRLFSSNSLSDQIIWFFPLSILGLIAAAIKEKLKPPSNNKRKMSLILWSMWLIPEFIYFSFTKGLFHPYYLTMMAPPIAALAGIGIMSMWEMYKVGGIKSWILPLSLVIDGIVQLLILSYYYNYSGIVKVLMAGAAVLCFTSSVILMIIRFKNNVKLKRRALALALTSSNGAGGMGFNTGNDTTAKLVSYLKKNAGSAKYLAAVPSSNGYASEIIINYGESVMTLGGFSGLDNILTLDEFKQLVKEGAVRYAILNGGNGPGGNSDITNWIKSNGKTVSESEWLGSSTSTSSDKNQHGGNLGGNSISLYDLKGIL